MLLTILKTLRYLPLVTAALSFSQGLYADETTSETTITDKAVTEVPTTDVVPINTGEVLPEAENIDLSEPVEEPLEELQAPEKTPVSKPDKVVETLPEKKPSVDSLDRDDKPSAVADTLEDRSTSSIDNREDEPFVMLNTAIPDGTTTRLAWSPDQTFKGISTPTPVLIAHGAKPGPKLCLTAAVHGDELNGIEIVRRVMYNIDVNELHGTVIGVPIVNLQGFRRSSRYLTDRRDLNRFFPGDLEGSSASRIAYSFFNEVITHCDKLVDLHTGSFYRTNLPQLRADLNDTTVVELTQAFDAIAVLHSEGAVGTLRRAAIDAGIPAVTLEAGGPMALNEEYVKQGVKAINTLLDKVGMLDTMSFWGTPQPTYYNSLWVRANQGGILFSDIKLGELVKKEDVLGKVTDPITNVRTLIKSPVNGRILGMALNQVVLPGFAAYHIGIDSEQSAEVLPPDKTIPVSNAEGALDNDEE